MNVRRIIPVGVVALALATCGGDTTTTTPVLEAVEPTPSSVIVTTTVATTTTTTVATTTTISEEELAAIQYEDDVLAIKTLFRRYSDSWFGGTEAGFAYLEAHNFPGEECTSEDFETDWAVPEDFQEEVVVDEETIERDDGWPIPGGAASGTVPDGRIYILTASYTDLGTGFDPVAVEAEVHATVLDDGTVHFFFTCGK